MYMNYINVSKSHILYIVIRRHSFYSYQGSLMLFSVRKIIPIDSGGVIVCELFEITGLSIMIVCWLKSY